MIPATDSLEKKAEMPAGLEVGQVVSIDTKDGIEKGVVILGPAESGNKKELRVKFADGTVDDWEIDDFVQPVKEDELATGVEKHAEALDRQLEQEVAPDLARYQQLLQLILSGHATEADNIEMERLSAVLNLDEDDGS